MDTIKNLPSVPFNVFEVDNTQRIIHFVPYLGGHYQLLIDELTTDKVSGQSFSLPGGKVGYITKIYDERIGPNNIDINEFKILMWCDE